MLNPNLEKFKSHSIFTLNYLQIRHCKKVPAIPNCFLDNKFIFIIYFIFSIILTSILLYFLLNIYYLNFSYYVSQLPGYYNINDLEDYKYNNNIYDNIYCALINDYKNKNILNLVTSPLDQFEIRELITIDAPILGYLHISLTNIGFYLTISAFIILMLNFLTANYKVVANSWSISQESVYATIHSIVVNQINAGKGQVYFPFIYALFIFILINNLIGMVPYSFASTSHFILTFFLSFTIVLGATILGFQRHGFKLFSLFVPSGCPLGLLPLLVLIEFISYLARNVSLGLRLAANILSGHMLLNILSGFAYNIMTSGFMYFFVGLIPLAFIIAFSGLELGIAFIQAQVFVVLTSSYIKDGLDLH